MDKKEEEFLNRLQAMFRVEAEEHINILSSGLIELEKKPKAKRLSELIESIFREAHSLKGAARSVNRTDIESICQVLESIFAKVKNEKFILTATQFDLIHKSIDIILNLIKGSIPKSDTETRIIRDQLLTISKSGSNKKQNILSEQSSTEPEPIEAFVEKQLIQQVSQNSSLDYPTENISDKTTEVGDKLLSRETVRIPIKKLDPLFLQAEQLIQSKITAKQRAVELQDIHNYIELWQTESKKRGFSSYTADANQLKEIVSWNNEKLDMLQETIASAAINIKNDQHLLGKMIDEHLESMKNILMLPISYLVEGFSKLVRELARSQGKNVDLLVYGKEIEVDKRILEELKDPLVHLIRNCIDHGIEKPKIRLNNQKPSNGSITLSFTVIDGRNLEIIISDDGAGIDPNKIKASVKKAGIHGIEDLDKLSDHEVLAFIFKSGVTSSPIITNISGRGLGLAIVSDKVEKLGGSISLESTKNNGTSFHLLLPLSLSTFRGILIKTANQLFAIPTANVKRAVRIHINDIKTVENRETIVLGTEILSLVKLCDVLGLNDKPSITKAQKNDIDPDTYFVNILIINFGTKQIGFKVDEILDEHQILVKELGKQLKKVRNISGAAVLGSGTIVPVINISDLMSSAVKEYKPVVNTQIEKTLETIFKILVTEDSITSRTLIRDILETAGYLVETAVDGVDGYTKALIGDFDLIVSDVDMPRMNGFELTTKIRNDKKLCDLPVVLVTALETREDKEHGIDVGANAYIIKSSFDQSNLLDVIQKLL